MKRLTPIAAVAVGSLLLGGCQSKRDICTEFMANPNPGNWSSVEHIADYWQQLGIDGEPPESYSDGLSGIEGFCEFYKS